MSTNSGVRHQMGSSSISRCYPAGTISSILLGISAQSLQAVMSLSTILRAGSLDFTSGGRPLCCLAAFGTSMCFHSQNNSNCHFSGGIRYRVVNHQLSCLLFQFSIHASRSATLPCVPSDSVRLSTVLPCCVKTASSSSSLKG